MGLWDELQQEGAYEPFGQPVYKEPSGLDFGEHGFIHKVAVIKAVPIRDLCLSLTLRVLEGPLEGREYAVVLSNKGYAAKYYRAHLEGFGVPWGGTPEEATASLQGLVANVCFNYYRNKAGVISVGLQQVAAA